MSQGPKSIEQGPKSIEQTYQHKCTISYDTIDL